MATPMDTIRLHDALQQHEAIFDDDRTFTGRCICGASSASYDEWLTHRTASVAHSIWGS